MYKKKLWFFFKGFVCLLGLSSSATGDSFADEIFAGEAINRTISALKKTGISDKSIGISVVKLPEVIYPFKLSRAGFNDTVAFNPASVMKLVTTRAALDLIGSDYRFTTRISTSGMRIQDELQGKIYFRGGGDPKLVVEDLENIIMDLRLSGYRVLSGKWIIDDSLFNIVEENPANFDGKPHKPYNVGPNAAMVNFKATEIIIERTGDGLSAKLKPELDGISLRTNLSKRRGGCSRNKYFVGFDSNILTIRGYLGKKCKSHSVYVSLLDHGKFS